MAVAQIIISIILIVLILLQEKSSGLSGVLGGSGSGPHQTKRGVEKFLHWGTIIFAVIFVVLALANLIF